MGVKVRRWVWPALPLIIVVIAGVIWHRHTYPYGVTHRCSIGLSHMLMAHADEHEGQYPVPEREDQLGLELLLHAEDPLSGDAFEIIVGKAGDVEAARAFYLEHGYLLKEHSSWHYVGGLTNEDPSLILCWDKIPLGHNGQRQRGNPREVIMATGFREFVHESAWSEFLERHSSRR